MFILRIPSSLRHVICFAYHFFPCQAVAAQKKASKDNKIRSELLALPSMSRIKIRVSAGVFEVSLIRVIEETSSVEVLWDRGVKREFKWGSVVFGNTDGPVLQKPSEMAVEPPKRTFRLVLSLSDPSHLRVISIAQVLLAQLSSPLMHLCAI